MVITTVTTVTTATAVQAKVSEATAITKEVTGLRLHL